MATNPFDKVYLSKSQLDTLANGGTITSGVDTYSADETTLYLTDEKITEEDLDQSLQEKINATSGVVVITLTDEELSSPLSDDTYNQIVNNDLVYIKSGSGEESMIYQKIGMDNNKIYFLILSVTYTQQFQISGVITIDRSTKEFEVPEAAYLLKGPGNAGTQGQILSINEYGNTKWTDVSQILVITVTDLTQTLSDDIYNKLVNTDIIYIKYDNLLYRKMNS